MSTQTIGADRTAIIRERITELSRIRDDARRRLGHVGNVDATAAALCIAELKLILRRAGET